MRTIFAIVGVLIIVLVLAFVARTPETAPATRDERAGNRTEKAGLIMVDNVDDNATLTSPFTVTGDARGTWYFEATFPLRVEDTDGTVLGNGYATAQSEWMTENFVPFSGSVYFDPGETTEGWLVLEKSNASGLPEHDDALRIPVAF